MTSVLSSFFSRDPRSGFSYELPNDFSTNYKGTFIGNTFKKSEPNEKVTCFWTNTWNSTLKSQAQKLKTLRHPNVLTYLDFLEVENEFYLITEPCQPLEQYLNQVKLSDSQKELLVSWGLYQILTCLKFLHNEGKISQNNIREAIFVTASGDWKLSGFQNTKPFSSPQMDLNDLAFVIWQIFNGFNTNTSEDAVRSISRIPKRLHPLYKQLSAKGKIVGVANLLKECRANGGFMKNKFVDTLLFLEEFQLKESSERQSFFVNLNDKLDMFPDDVAKNKILPKLIHTYEYGDAGPHILVPMFKLGRLLDEEEYQYRIVPCLVKLFGSTDRTTRVKLLERIDEFAPHLKPQVINDSIYGNLIGGFTDTNPEVRERTVKAMVVFAEKLNYHNLNTDLMKYLARLQGGDEQPSIRTNTTICLGKIGCFIDPSHRQRILISAFSRALKDPFPPARMAGVLALCATQQYYSLLEISTKILPSLCIATMDPEKQVRDQSFKTIKGFLEKLEKASENPESIPEIEAQVKAGGKNSLLSSEKFLRFRRQCSIRKLPKSVPQWAGWALKTISGKFYKSTAPAISSTTTATAYNSTTSKNEPNSSRKLSNDSATTKIQEEKPTPPPPTTTTMGILDGWGDLAADEDDDEFLDANSGGKFSNFNSANNLNDLIGKNLEEFDGWGVDNGGGDEERENNGFCEQLSEWDAFETAQPKADDDTSKNDLNSVDFGASAEADWSTEWEKPVAITTKTTTTTTNPIKTTQEARQAAAKARIKTVGCSNSSPRTTKTGPLKLGLKKLPNSQNADIDFNLF